MQHDGSVIIFFEYIVLVVLRLAQLSLSLRNYDGIKGLTVKLLNHYFLFSSGRKIWIFIIGKLNVSRLIQ